MADQDITTSIDDLVKYLTAHGETESSELAKALGVSENIIGKWTDVLEKAKVVKMQLQGRQDVHRPCHSTRRAELSSPRRPSK